MFVVDRWAGGKNPFRFRLQR